MLLVYVAGRFRGPDQETIDANIDAARFAGRLLAERGHMPIIPHSTTVGFNNVQTPEFWLEGTMELMLRSDAVLLIAGWRESPGAVAERSVAIARGMPVYTNVEDIENG